jgi:hypothetical protein
MSGDTVDRGSVCPSVDSSFIVPDEDPFAFYSFNEMQVDVSFDFAEYNHADSEGCVKSHGCELYGHSAGDDSYHAVAFRVDCGGFACG